MTPDNPDVPESTQTPPERLVQGVVVWRIDEDRWWTGRHAVLRGRTVGKALCGRVPWDRWSEPHGAAVAKCEICLKLAPDDRTELLPPDSAGGSRKEQSNDK